MVLGYLVLYVANVLKSMEFYHQAFGLEKKFLHEDNLYGEMQTGTTTLGFASNECAQSNLPQEFLRNSRQNAIGGMEVGFVTHDVEAAFERALEQGALAVTKPVLKPWGQTVAYVRDWDGILISLGSPLS